MSLAEVGRLVLGTLQGLGGIVIFLLVVMIGFCFVFDWTKFRPRAKTRTVKSLDELVGPAITYLPPDAPSGPSDQLAGSGR